MRYRLSSLGSIALVVFALSLVPSATTAAGLFFDDFSNLNAAGWTIGSEWQIGATFQSPSPATGNPDPAFDHSPTADNRVAGAVLGGNVNTNQHAFFFFTSPVINTDVPEPIVSLEYFRWLNGDNTPFMNQVIEVFDGTQFQRVFETGANAPADAEWTFHQIDLSAYKNSQMRIRFGHNVAASGAFTVSGWNIDDVAVAAVPEPARLALLLPGLLLTRRNRSRTQGQANLVIRGARARSRAPLEVSSKTRLPLAPLSSLSVRPVRNHVVPERRYVPFCADAHTVFP